MVSRLGGDEFTVLLAGLREPDEAAIVCELAERYLRGESTYALAEDLNTRGVLVPSGAVWSETRIKRALDIAHKLRTYTLYDDRKPE